MTIEERVRRMLAEAVAGEPAPSGAPFERAVRRGRRRPVRAIVVTMTLLLTAAGLAAGVRALATKPAPLPTVPPVRPAVPPGWKTFQSAGPYNLTFRYPPDWVVEGRGGFVIAPRQFASPDQSHPTGGPFGIGVDLGPQYYLFVVQNGARVTRGRLPDGRAFVRSASSQAGTRIVEYWIDWGQYCIGRGQDCGAKSIAVSIQATSRALLERYSQVAEQIVRTFRPARPTAASTGDRTRAACRPDQWRPVVSSENKATLDGPGGWVISGDIRYLQGPPCHLRTTLRLTVEQADGTPIAVPGTPSPFTVEADLPENGGVAGDVPRLATMWFWVWDNWCRQPLPQARVRVTADSGASTTRPLPPRSIQDPRYPCQPNAPWKVVPLP
jgi:hypothetical protein